VYIRKVVWCSWETRGELNRFILIFIDIVPHKTPDLLVGGFVYLGEFAFFSTLPINRVLHVLKAKGQLSTKIKSQIVPF
jgi:hypothetical protein